MAAMLKLMGALLFIGHAVAAPAPIVVHPLPGDYVVTSNNTINSTHPHQPSSGNEDFVANTATSPSSPLPLNLVNNIGGNVNAYITGLDDTGAAFFLQSNGQPYYPPNPPSGIPPTKITQNIAIPLGGQGSTTPLNLPMYISSGRIYFSQGTMSFAVNNGPSGPEIVAPSFTNPSDPNAAVDYGFVEFTWTEDGGIYSNLSYVDFVGLVISQILKSATQTCTVKGLPSNGASLVCNGLKSATTSTDLWDEACQTDSNGNVLRVLAPLHLLEENSNALPNYYTSYIDQVWSKYTSEQLTVDAGNNGKFTGQVDTATGNLTFNEGGSFAKPDMTDIFGCASGPFSNPIGSDPETRARAAIVPILCAAFDRSTLLLDGGNVQPSGVPSASQYYPNGVPTNVYARIIHQNEIDGKGYAFPYDDVNPTDGSAVSGLCNDPAPESVTFYVGGIGS